MQVRIFLVLLFVFFQPNGISAAPEQYGLTNARPEAVRPQAQSRPVIILRDGERVDPWTVLPEGWIVGDDGSILTDDGVILKTDGSLEYPFGSLPEGYVTRPDGTVVTPEGFVIAKPEKETGAAAPELGHYPGEAVLLPDGSIVGPDGRVLKPAGEKPGQSVQAEKEAAQETTPAVVDERKPEKPEKEAVRETAPVVVDGRKPQAGPQLWSMLPLSEVPGRTVKDERRTEKPVKPEKQKPDKPKQEKPKPEKPKQEKPKPVKPEREKPAPKVGEALRIPPEAIRDGNLDFLEGCWQGTRPEYYSKRTIQECFCFGKQGKNGKRRVIDPQFNRRCVGGTQARLDPNGVLHVSSQGAVCSDGERWGQAEMTCRGRGKQTPCSWVFKDAQGGRQSYEIPFVRVQSCGRRR